MACLEGFIIPLVKKKKILEAILREVKARYQEAIENNDRRRASHLDRSLVAINQALDQVTWPLKVLNRIYNAKQRSLMF